MKKNVVIIVGIVVVVLLVVSVGFAYSKNNQAVAAYNLLKGSQEQIDDLTVQNGELQKQIEELQNELDSLKTGIAEKETEIDSLVQENSDLQKSLTQLEADLEEEKAKAEETAKAKTATPAPTAQPADSSVIVDQTESKSTSNDDGWASLAEELGITETVIENNGRGRDMSGFVGGNWE